MKIALIGYGKMGKAIEKIALDRGHQIVLAINSTNHDKLTVENIKTADVAIEFTQPASAIKNIGTCLDAQVPVAIGTTGWYDELEKVEQHCTKQNGCMLAATNFSVGVNIFFELTKQLSKLMSKRSDYTADIQEIHHTEKLDSPSGTAITLAENIIGEHTTYNSWKNEATEDNSALEIISFRENNVPGTHEITFDSSIDKISLKHEAKNREGFALGAVLAAEFIHNKKGIYTMADVLKN